MPKAKNPGGEKKTRKSASTSTSKGKGQAPRGGKKKGR